MANGIRRRRECVKCAFRFPTQEVVMTKQAAKPREEKKLPPLVKTVEGKRRPDDWPECETDEEDLPHEFIRHLGTPGRCSDE